MRCVLTLLPMLILGCIDDVALPQESGCSGPECPTTQPAPEKDDPAHDPSTRDEGQMSPHERALAPGHISKSTQFTMSAHATQLRSVSENGAYHFTTSDPVGTRTSRNGQFIMEARIRP